MQQYKVRLDNNKKMKIELEGPCKTLYVKDGISY